MRIPFGGVLVLLVVFLSSDALPPVAAASDDKAAIIQTALDYAEGYYGGEPARMARAVSPYLSKRQAMLRPGAATLLGEMNADTLIEFSNGFKLAPDARKMTAEVLDIGADTASARVFSVQFNDYLHLVKRNGAWQIVNVLWHAPPSTPSEDQTAAINEAVRSFAVAMTTAGTSPPATLHSLAHIRVIAPARQGRPRFVQDQNAEAFTAGLARGAGKLTGTLEDFKISVEGVDNDIAAARILAGATRIYLHLLRSEGQWRIVTVLRSVEAAPSGSGGRGLASLGGRGL